MSLYAAIDLHSSNSVLAVMDGEGKALLQCRRPNDLPRLLSDLAPDRNELVGVAVESTYNLVLAGRWPDGSISRRETAHS